MSVLCRLATNLSDLIIHQIFGFNKFSPMFVINIGKPLNPRSNEREKPLIDDIMNNGFLLAVQKKRRTVESKLRRRFGVERYPQDCAIIRPKHNIIVCDHCGHYHELHTICGNCYKQVKEETVLVIDEIKKRFNCFKPIEEEVGIKYKDDIKEDNEMSGKVIVEMDRQRPEWFAKNLLSKTVGNKWVETKPIVSEDEPIVSRK